MIGIYKITSPSNKVYIGKSKNIYKRKSDYSKLSCKRQNKLYNSLVKYGFKNHKFEVLLKLPKSISDIELSRYERHYYNIEIMQDRVMLNLKIPGEKGNGGHSQESKDKISNKNRKHYYIITQFTKAGEFLKVWDSPYEAAKTLNINKQYIINNIKGNIVATKSYIFIKGEFSETVIPKEIQNIKKKVSKLKKCTKRKTVYQYDHGKLVKEWVSMQIAAKTLGLNAGCISAANNGITKQHGGFQWTTTKYL